MEQFSEFIVALTLGFCLCVGYIIKNLIPSDAVNRFIPLIMGALGVAVNCWLSLAVSPETVFSGLISGLASTGMYEAFHQMISGK